MLIAFCSPCVGKRELVFVLIVHLFVSYAHANLCHFFSSSWDQGLAATSAYDSSLTFLFTFLNDLLEFMRAHSLFAYDTPFRKSHTQKKTENNPFQFCLK